MSCLVIPPPRPVRRSRARLSKRSRAILRTSGEERVSSSSDEAWDGEGDGAWLEAGVSAVADLASSFRSGAVDLAGADCAGLVAADSPSAAMGPTVLFTPTVAPSITF